MVRRILNEEITKRVPEMMANGIDEESDEKTKTFPSDPNPRDAGTKEEMLTQLTKAVEAVDKTFIVTWDDHDDLTINGGDMLQVWITPLWEDNYKIVYMPRKEDRYFFTGLTWKQVLEFVKNNLDPKKHTAVEKARDKSWRNQEDQTDSPDKGLNQKDKPKHMTPDKLKAKNKEKRYVEDEVKEEKDLPDKPMREPGKTELQRDYKVNNPNTLTKKMSNSRLVAGKRKQTEL